MMAYAHSFTARFYGDPYSATPSDRPTTVADALASVADNEWDLMCHDVFGCAGEYLDVDTVLERIRETDTVSSFQPPVEVWIDDDGVHTVLVHDTEGGAG